MELLQLEYFRTVAETGKISTAAQKLYISPPSLSATIKRLEKELGCTLFTRTGNAIKLNAQGEVFLRYVQQALSCLEIGKAQLSRFSEPKQNHLNIAATTSNLWVGLLSAFSLDHPQITISTTSLKLTQLNDSTLPSKYSFLLTEASDFSRCGADDAIYETRVLIERDLPVLVVPRNHPLARLSSADLSKLRAETFLLSVADTSANRMALELLEKAGIPGTKSPECSYMLRRQMLLENRGIAFSTEYTGRSEDQSFAYIPIGSPVMPQKHLACWDKEKKLREEEQIFLNFARDYFCLNAV